MLHSSPVGGGGPCAAWWGGNASSSVLRYCFPLHHPSGGPPPPTGEEKVVSVARGPPLGLRRPCGPRRPHVLALHGHLVRVGERQPARLQRLLGPLGQVEA